MLRIGIVGAENSHCAAVAKLCNVDRKVAVRVVSVWGERPKYARAAAEAGRIPLIVKDWRLMLGDVDGVMIDHRHAKDHAAPARFFIENRVPAFIDKPFTFSLNEGRKLCLLAREKRVPITSFSVIPRHQSFKDFVAAAAKCGDALHLTTSGPCDSRSKHGGIFFYGIHQVDAIIELLGTHVTRVNVQRHGADVVATLMYHKGPVVTMIGVASGQRCFHWSLRGTEGAVDWEHKNNADPYEAGVRFFARMFRTGKEPIPHERLLAPVAVLEAMAKSLARGRPVNVATIAL